jgi:hypothetical protein
MRRELRAVEPGIIARLSAQTACGSMSSRVICRHRRNLAHCAFDLWRRNRSKEHHLPSERISVRRLLRAGPWAGVRIRFRVLAVCILALVGLCIASVVPASAHPYGSGHGVAAFSSFGGVISNLDGVSATFNVISLNVPTTCGARYTPASGCGVTGGNARPMQIGATAPQSAVQRGEFVGFGYNAGCAVAPLGCSGEANGSYRERLYYDGVNDIGRYVGAQQDDVATGTSVNLQIVRFGSSWMMHVNGTHRWSLVTLSMTQGFGSVGSESSGGAGVATIKNQVYAAWKHKQLSAGFADVGAIYAEQPHSPACRVLSFTPSSGFGSVLEITGSC